MSKAPYNRNKIRNLAQYKDLTDDEFEEIWIDKFLHAAPSDEFEDRISKKMDEFGDDYDLSDLKINDKASLRALIQAIISLEDYEQAMFQFRSDGISQNAINSIDKLNRVMSALRGDISKLQDDLNIKRKARQSDEDLSVLNYIDELKHKARKFYEAKNQYIFCECGMLLGTVWSLYVHEKDNKIRFKCNRKLEDGNICGKITTVSTENMANNKGSNSSELMPEGLN